MNEAVRELAKDRPENAAIILGRRGVAPLDVAIALLGGVGETAKRLGVSRQTFNRMVNAGIGMWDTRHTKRLAELTGIPMETLTLSAEEMAKRK